jgi:transposase
MAMKKRKIRFDGDECDFFKLSKQEADPQKRVRLLALGQLKDGTKITKVAKSIGADRHSVGYWYDAYKAEGLAGLNNKPRPGKEPKLAREKEQDFLKAIDKMQETKSGGRITGYDIQKLAKDSFDADYADDTIYTVLKRLGYSWITARSKHPKSDKAAQEAFKKTLKMRWQKHCQQKSN